MFKNMKLGTKILVAFLVVGVIPFATVSIVSLRKADNALSSQAFAQLTAVRDLKKKQVEDYFKELHNRIVGFSQNSHTIYAVAEFSYSFKNYFNEQNISQETREKMIKDLKAFYREEYAEEFKKRNNGKSPDIEGIVDKFNKNTIALQHDFIAINEHPIGSKHLLDYSSIKNHSTYYNTQHRDYHPTFRKQMETYGYHDIMLVNSDNGIVVYSVSKETTLGTSLLDGPYADSVLGKLFKRAIALENADEVVVSDFEPFSPSFDEPAAFIASPMIENEQIIGIAIFQLPLDFLNSIMSERSGMGETGETYLVGSDKLMRSDSYTDPEFHSVRNSFKNPEKGKVDTEASVAALSGETNHKILRDYNGNIVLSAYTPLTVSGMNWALLAQINKSEALSTLNSLKWIIGIVACVGLAVILGVAYIVTRQITQPVDQISRNLKDGADRVAVSSSQVSSASQMLAEGSGQQAASIQETSASLEEMATMTKQNADHAKQADQLMAEAKNVVEQANGSMGALTKAMTHISEASEETSKIIKTIDEIAFQTNLLALNAAVEAARAGEAGAGFAVVADEVRNLAMRAADAAKNTAALIESTVTKVNDGSSLVSEASDAFSQVTESTSKVGELVSDIAAASQEQSQGIDQVNLAVTEMDKVVQQNAASAEESAGASEEMTGQAEKMNTMVEKLTHLVWGGTERVNDGKSFLGRLTKGKNIEAFDTMQGDTAPKNSRQMISMDH